MIKLNKKRGFTLMELLVVLIIIGILCAVGIPQYLNVVEGTHGKTTISNIRIIVEAWKRYNMSNPFWKGKPGGYFTPDQINQELGIHITEKYFGNPNNGKCGYQLFYIDDANPCYRVITNRISGTHSAKSIWFRKWLDGSTSWSGTWIDCFGQPD